MVQKKYRLIAKQKSKTQSKFNVILWNADGLNNSKILQIEHEIASEDPDLFVIIDAGSLCEKEEELLNYFHNYQLKTKKRDRKISSGMIVGVKRTLTCSFRIVKHMTNADRLEAIYIAVWKDKIKYPFCAPNTTHQIIKETTTYCQLKLIAFCLATLIAHRHDGITRKPIILENT